MSESYEYTADGFEVLVKRHRKDAAVMRSYAARMAEERGDYEFVADVVGEVMGMSPRRASNWLEVAQALDGPLRSTFEALLAGEICEERMQAIYSKTQWLAADKVPAVEQVALDNALWSSPRELAGIMDEEILRVDPDGYADRKSRRMHQRKLEHRTGSDGVSTLAITGDEATNHAITQHVGALAKKLRRDGDEREMDQLRCDISQQLLLGTFDGAGEVKAEIIIHLTPDILAGFSDAPAQVAGMGPIPAQVARDYAAKGDWYRLVEDPVTGVGIKAETKSRFPTPGMRRLLFSTHKTCSAPFCMAAAVTCDIDHCRRHEDGGKTCICNLLPLCRHHHRLKDEGNWSYIKNPVRFPLFAGHFGCGVRWCGESRFAWLRTRWG
ncbi:HNH endonuclease [Pseudonocardiaceae bacterium YIM PH 21723]|nr:HNH endonuclease [Pseudonocardiaceae bacterium YIM PH 21723]